MFLEIRFFLVLRERSTNEPNLQDILRKFKVPFGLNDVEKEQMKDYFLSEEEKNAKASIFGKMNAWLSGNSSKKSLNDAAEGVLGRNSKAIFLMAPDNKFLNFYRLDLTPKELAE